MKRFFSKWLIVIPFLIIFLSCGGFLIKEVLWRQKSNVTYEAVARDVWKVPKNTAQIREKTAGPEKQDTEGEISYDSPPGLKSLMEENDRVVGWIYIEGTQIDYPILQHPSDNSFYLHRDLNGNSIYSGAIFLDTIHSFGKPGIKLVYGHHMKSSWKYGVMFRELVNYRDEEFMAGHDDVVIWTDKTEYHYRPVYCYAGKADGTYRNRLFLRSELGEFFRNKTGIEIDSDDILVLVTCSYGSSDERTYVICSPRL